MNIWIHRKFFLYFFLVNFTRYRLYFVLVSSTWYSVYFVLVSSTWYSVYFVLVSSTWYSVYFVLVRSTWYSVYFVLVSSTWYSVYCVLRDRIRLKRLDIPFFNMWNSFFLDWRGWTSRGHGKSSSDGCARSWACAQYTLSNSLRSRSASYPFCCCLSCKKVKIT